MYVEYQIPATLKYAYPIVLMHGDGHTGEFFRTTPDGREGWFTSFARLGFAVYSVDGANRGRAGWDPTKRFAATQGLISPSSMEAASIYSEQSAWVAYRWGPAFGTAYTNTQFPLNHVQDYLKEIQPKPSTTTRQTPSSKLSWKRSSIRSALGYRLAGRQAAAMSWSQQPRRPIA